MKLCVISPKGCTESAQELAEALGAKYANPYLHQWTDYRQVDVVFNYGVKTGILAKKIINKPSAVAVCINKIETFKRLKAANLPHPAFTTRFKDIPKEWDIVVCRKTASGRANEGMEMIYQENGLPKDCELYTHHFDHKWEYRVVVFMGKVVARYRKDITKQETWKFTLMLPQGFEQVDKDCLVAAKALGIDYVGFDIIENKKGQYVFLEANSGPVLTKEVKAAIIKHFKK